MILIVDDNTDLGELLVLFLEQAGSEAMCVHSGDEAIKLLEASLPMLVVLDDAMPGMSGLDVIERLRESDRYKALPIVFLSAGSDEARRRKAFELGAAEWIRKGETPWATVVERVRTLARQAG